MDRTNEEWEMLFEHKKCENDVLRRRIEELDDEVARLNSQNGHLQAASFAKDLEISMLRRDNKAMQDNCCCWRCDCLD